MKKIILLSLFLFCLLNINSYAGDTTNPHTGELQKYPEFQQSDGSGGNYPEIVKVNHTDNGDGSITITGGSGAPTDADYLVGTANGSLSAEIVVGTTPGGELGNTWASPTIDATHSGSAHSSYLPLTGGTLSGALTINDNNATGSTLLTIGDATDADSAQIFGDLTITGGDITLGTTSIFSGGDTASLNNIDAIDATTETTLEAAIDTLASLTLTTVLGSVDIGGATSLEIPNAAGNVTLSSGGQVGIDTTNSQFVWHDGSNEIAIPGIKIAQGTFDLAAQWDVDSDLWLTDLHADSYPNGIYITKIYVDATVADPTTELDANLMYCDAVANGAFPGATATLIKAIDTTTGNFADTAVNTAVATGKTIYIDIDADPTDANTQYHIRIHYRIEED